MNFRSVLLLTCWLFCVAAQAATLEGAVVDIEGAPVADAQLWLWQAEGVDRGTSDAEGHYEFDTLDVGPFHVIALHPDHALDGFTGFAAGDAEIDIVLRAYATQTIHVVNDGFRSLAGARVHRLSIEGRVEVPVSELTAEGFPELRSADDGLITIPNLPEQGFIRLVVRHFKYADTYIPFMPVRGETDDVQLVPGLDVAGRATGPDGPLADTQVHIYRLTPQGQQEVASIRTDGDGAYSARVAPGPYLVAARHADLAPPPPQKIQLEEGREVPPIDFNLVTPRRIKGSVVGPKDEAIPAARIQWIKGDVIYDETFSNNAGRFSLLVADRQGTMRILTPPGYMTEQLDVIPVDMGEEYAVTLSPIRLERLPLIEGVVLDEEGAPVPRALISSMNLPQPIWLVCDEEGRFRAQFAAIPDVERMMFTAEHPLRFTRAEFSVSPRKPKPVKARLRPYKPDAETRKAEGPGNKLDKLIGEPAPEFECREWFNIDAEHATNETLLSGAVTVLVFWGGFDQTDGGINRIDQVRALQAVLTGVEDVRFLAIHDATSDGVEVEQYLKDFRVDFPVGLDAHPFVTFDRYGINFIPDTILIDKEGKVAYAEVEDRMLELIKIMRR